MNWTPGRIKGFITSVLRGGYRRWPPKFEVLNAAKVGKQTNKKTNREAMHYLCDSCQGTFPAKEVQVDHIAPVVADTFIDWNTFIERLFCEADNLQVLCTECHKKKSLQEKQKRTKK